MIYGTKSNRDKHVNLKLAFIFLLFAHEQKELFFFVPRIIHRYLYKMLYLIYHVDLDSDMNMRENQIIIMKYSS